MRLRLTGKAAGAFAAFAVATLAVLFGSDAMALFSKKVLFSRVEGQVLLNGEPVAGAEILQRAQLAGNEPIRASARTDTTGHFTLDEITRSGRMIDLLPTEVVVTQSISISHGNKEHEGWLHTKRNYDRNGELDGKPLQLVCELSEQPDFTDNYYGICRVVS
jgi:hypothetical protein